MKIAGWDGDIQCFVSQECTSISFVADLQNLLPLGVEISSTIAGEYRWIYVDDKVFVVQRRWMPVPGESNRDWLNIDQDYALAVYLPTEGGMRFLDMEWVVTYFGDMPVPEDFALSLAIQSMHEGRKNVEAYIDTLGD